MLEMRTFHGYGFKPTRRIETEMISNDAIVWADGFMGFGGKKYVGTNDNLYLLLKWFKLQLSSQSRSDHLAVRAGVNLRRHCREADAKEGNGKCEPVLRLPSSGRSLNEFEITFDEALR